MRSLISIIIPTYNRAHLIGETLDSIIAQTYTHWDCIVVDDGSTDYTDELLEFYCLKDPRIQYHHLPDSRPKGANACRNYGFEVSKGEYINWFDSDDLMLKDNLSSKFEAFEEDVDFVIGNSINFDEFGNKTRPFSLNHDLPITAENFIGGEIGWMTIDVMFTRGCLSIRFNEHLKSGQEYNFFARFLFKNSHGKYLKKDIAMRRIHSASIQQRLEVNQIVKTETLFQNEIHLINDIESLASESIIDRSLRRIVRFSYLLSSTFKISDRQNKVIHLLFRFKRYRSGIYYFLWIFTNRIVGKGYFLVKKILQAVK
jgi:glycosyltransferase involved in cell wall biosynthesis